MAEQTTRLGPRLGELDADGFRLVSFESETHNATYRGTRARVEAGGLSRVRIETGRANANDVGTLHGGFMLSFLDHALFIGPVTAGQLQFGTAVTLTLATQFIGAGRIGEPLDCVVEVTGETGRLLFLRGFLEQGDHRVMSWDATLRKMAGAAPIGDAA